MAYGQLGDELSFFEIQKDLKGYSLRSFFWDISSGFTVALITLPQAMAFALVAGLPISCGLYAAIFASFCAALFGSSRHTVIGPSTAIAILVQYGISEILFTYYRDVSPEVREVLSLQILTQICLLIGVIQVLAAFFRLGQLTHFVSDPVIVGFLMGTAAALTINQIFVFLGIPNPEVPSSLFDQAVYILGHLRQVNLTTAFVGFMSLGLLVSLSKKISTVTAAVVMLAFVVGFVYLFGWNAEAPTFFGVGIPRTAVVSDVGTMDLSAFPFSWPYFQYGMLSKLLPVAFAISLLSTLETASVARSIASSSGQRLSVNQEILGLGIGNLISAFTCALPNSGSASRSSMLFHLGAVTRLSSMWNSVFVGVIVFLFGGFVEMIPLAALAAILLANIKNIVNKRTFLLCLKATSSDACVMLTTFVCCLFFGLDVAFYIGVAISITLYLKKAAVPHLVECTFEDTGQIHRMESSHKREPQKIRVINVQGELFFGAADIFQRTLKSTTEDDASTKVVILRLKNARDIDATACLALRQLSDYLRSSGRHLIACGLQEQSWEVLSHAGIIDEIGKENCFINDEKRPYLSMQNALKRASELIHGAVAPAEPQQQQERPLLPLEPQVVSEGPA